jgi:hypothetical protein
MYSRQWGYTEWAPYGSNLSQGPVIINGVSGGMSLGFVAVHHQRSLSGWGLVPRHGSCTAGATQVVSLDVLDDTKAPPDGAPIMAVVSD